MATKLLLSSHWKNGKWPHTGGCFIFWQAQYIKVKKDLIISTVVLLSSNPCPLHFSLSIARMWGRISQSLSVSFSSFFSKYTVPPKISYCIVIMSQMPKKNQIFLTFPKISAKFDLSLLLHLSFYFLKCKIWKINGTRLN